MTKCGCGPARSTPLARQRENGKGFTMSGTPTQSFPALSSALDPQLLAAAYARHGRIHIPAVLTADSAARLHRALSEEAPYNLTLNSGAKVFDISPSDYA